MDPIFQRPLIRGDFAVHSLATAAALAEHAAAVYRSGAEYAATVRGGRWPVATQVVAGVTRVGVAVSPSTVVLACRGSDDAGDWLENLLALRVGWRPVLPPGVGVHLGFRRQAERIRAELFGVLDVAELNGDHRVILTGHSLGGAMALLLAAALRADGRRVDAVVTFNAPRVGGRRWAAWETWESTTVARFVVARQGERDLVSRLPLSRFGWEHVGAPTVVAGENIARGEAAWQRLRAENPTGLLAGWRVFSRLRAGIAAHDAGRAAGLLAVLGERELGGCGVPQ